MIQSSFSPAELKEAISTGNVNAIKSVKGIGLKSAQRIIVDLKDKVNKSNEGGDLPLIEVAANNEKIHEAVAALVILGFQQQASQKTVDKIVKEEPQLEVAKIIKKALSMI